MTTFSRASRSPSYRLSALEPATNPPPGIETSTGRRAFALRAGVQTLRVRQSSPICCLGTAPGGCGQESENVLLTRMPSQTFTGCGARQRNSPTGGAAYGIPLYTRTSVPDPSTYPESIFTTLSRSLANTGTDSTRQRNSSRCRMGASDALELASIVARTRPLPHVAPVMAQGHDFRHGPSSRAPATMPAHETHQARRVRSHPVVARVLAARAHVDLLRNDERPEGLRVAGRVRGVRRDRSGRPGNADRAGSEPRRRHHHPQHTAAQRLRHAGAGQRHQQIRPGCRADFAGGPIAEHYLGTRSLGDGGRHRDPVDRDSGRAGELGRCVGKRQRHCRCDGLFSDLFPAVHARARLDHRAGTAQHRAAREP